MASKLVDGLKAQGIESVQSAEADTPVLILAEPGGKGSTQVHIDWLQKLQAEAVGQHPIVLLDEHDPERLTLDAAWEAGVSGLAKTASREWPDRIVRLVHMADTQSESIARLVEELPGTGGDSEILIRQGEVSSPAEAPVHASGNSAAITASDVFLVTGGARGVTASCVVDLALRTGARFVLAGRSALMDWPTRLPVTSDLVTLRGALLADAKTRGEAVTPRQIDGTARALLASQEVRNTLSQIEAAGSDAVYLPIDISSSTGCARLVTSAREAFGRITGIIHGAGVLADKFIEEKTPEQVEKVFGPKVEGLRDLLNALEPEELRHVALFSSVAARYGNAGQADYAMANEVLNRTARALKMEDPSRTVVSFNWGPWDGGMVSPELARHFAAQGVALLPTDQGTRVFSEMLMTGPDAPVELVVAGANAANGLGPA